jgi:hypothetical protein
MTSRTLQRNWSHIMGGRLGGSTSQGGSMSQRGSASWGGRDIFMGRWWKKKCPWDFVSGLDMALKTRRA